MTFWHTVAVGYRYPFHYSVQCTPTDSLAPEQSFPTFLTSDPISRYLIFGDPMTPFMRRPLVDMRLGRGGVTGDIEGYNHCYYIKLFRKVIR